MRIAEPFKLPGGESGFDMWPAFRALGGAPALLLRGELSDLLSEETAARMRTEAPSLEVATVPRVGHAPTLDEPEAQASDRAPARPRHDGPKATSGNSARPPGVLPARRTSDGDPARSPRAADPAALPKRRRRQPDVDVPAPAEQP